MGTRQTAEFWDEKWDATLGRPRWTEGMVERTAEILGGLPDARVDEYGFGGAELADMIPDWRGFDFSEVAVAAALNKGHLAVMRRCADAVPVTKSYIVGIALLPNLSSDERDKFLERVSGAPHAFFGVKRHRPDVPEYATAEGFRNLLLKYWGAVTVEVVGPGFLAHCAKVEPSSNGSPVLTVGSSTLLDFGGTKWTLASWMTHHGTFGGKVEYVVVDNHPEATVRCRGVRGFFCKECERIKEDGPECPKCRDNLATMQQMVEGEGGRYVRWSEKQGTYPGKNQLKVEAKGKFVLTMDSHVLLTPGAIRTCLAQIEEEPESDDFFHFPNLFRSYTPGHAGRPAAVDFRKQDWIYHGDGPARGSVYGWTKNANTAGKPYPVAAMITSCYMVKKAAWFSAKGYDPILGNYGGWEGPIQMKWWLMGRKVRQMRYRSQGEIERNGFLHHYHEFWNKQTRKTSDNHTQHVHSGLAKQRNFAASSAVIGGEWWVRRHCALKGWNFDAAQIREGMAEGLKLRPWMIENLARPEWEDIREFFKWMRDEEKVPGALKGW